MMATDRIGAEKDVVATVEHEKSKEVQLDMFSESPAPHPAPNSVAENDLGIEVSALTNEEHFSKDAIMQMMFESQQIKESTLVAEAGDMVGGLLRQGDAGNAEQADTWIPHLIKLIKDSTGVQAKVRFDAGFTGDPTLKALEKENIKYVGRIKSNAVLQRLAEPYLRRPSGRPPNHLREWCHDLRYQAGSWEDERRVILVVLERLGELFLDSFVLVTNLDEHVWTPRKSLALYRKRGKAEAHMGEVKSTLNVHLSSTCRGRSTLQQVMARNEINLLLSLYAYQIMHGLRCVMEQQTRTGWSINRLREQVLKVAATLTVHA